VIGELPCLAVAGVYFVPFGRYHRTMASKGTDQELAQDQQKQVEEIGSRIQKAAQEHGFHRQLETCQRGGFNRAFRAWRKAEKKRLHRLEVLLNQETKAHLELHRLLCREKSPTCSPFEFVGGVWKGRMLRGQSCTARDESVRLHARTCFELAQSLFWERDKVLTRASGKQLPGRPDPTIPKVGAFYCWLTDVVHLNDTEIALWVWQSKAPETKLPLASKNLRSHAHRVAAEKYRHRQPPEQ
jgi:hypothetical protein